MNMGTTIIKYRVDMFENEVVVSVRGGYPNSWNYDIKEWDKKKIHKDLKLLIVKAYNQKIIRDNNYKQPMASYDRTKLEYDYTL